MMIHKMRKCFGYTYLWTCDKEMQNVLLGYCEGRSILWRMFLGWRRTTKEQMFFWIPSRKIDYLIEIVETA